MMFKKGFSYAEAMVTMLIVAIIMVATTPILSKKMNAKKHEIWGLTTNASAFFGTGDTQRVIIGSNNAERESARLIIKSAYDNRLATDIATLPPIINFINSNNNEIGRITTTQSSLALGRNALSKAEGSLNDDLKSTAIGAGALQNIVGNSNTAIGYNACTNLIQGNGNICIGTDAGPENENYEISNKLYIDNKATNTPLIEGDFINRNITINGILRLKDENGENINVRQSIINAANGIIDSDARLKNINGKSITGLEEINKLEIKNFTYKQDKEKTPHVGVIAQELIKIFPNSVIKGEDGYYKIKKEEMFYAMINAIKELDKKFNKNNEKTTKLETEITKLKTENEILTQKIAEIEKKLQEK